MILNGSKVKLHKWDISNLIFVNFNEIRQINWSIYKQKFGYINYMWNNIVVDFR